MNEAELVLTHIMDCDRMSLYLNRDASLDPDKSAALSSVFMRRLSASGSVYTGQDRIYGIGV